MGCSSRSEVTTGMQTILGKGVEQTIRGSSDQTGPMEQFLVAPSWKTGSSQRHRGNSMAETGRRGLAKEPIRRHQVQEVPTAPQGWRSTICPVLSLTFSAPSRQLGSAPRWPRPACHGFARRPCRSLENQNPQPTPHCSHECVVETARKHMGPVGFVCCVAAPHGPLSQSAMRREQ